MTRRLRLKTGCLSCRRRRVKCGEEKPDCRACVRLKFRCVWPEPSCKPHARNGDTKHHMTDDAALLLRTPTLLSFQSGSIANGVQSFESQLQYSLTFRAPRMLSAVLNTEAATEWRDTSFLVPMALQVPSVRHALAAFSGQILARHNSDLLPIAVSEYTRTVSGLIKRLQTPMELLDGREFLVMTMLASSYESFGRGNFLSAFSHSSAQLKYLTQIAKYRVNSNDHFMQFCCRLSVEVSLYVTAGLSIYLPGLESFFRNLNWSGLDMYLELPGFNDYRKSPFLLGQAEIFKILLQVVHIARFGSISSSAPRDVQNLVNRLSVLESKLWPSFRTMEDQLVAEFFVLRWRLMISVIRIYIAKVANPKWCSGTTRMRQLVRESIMLLVEMETTKFHPLSYACHAPFFCRDLGATQNPQAFAIVVILMCAVHGEDELEVVAAKMCHSDRMHQSGFYTWITKLKLFIQCRKSENLQQCHALKGESCDYPHDGLDLLLHREGIFWKLYESTVFSDDAEGGRDLSKLFPMR